VLAGRAKTMPKTANGSIESIRLVRIARNTAMKAHTSAMIALKATLVTANDELRAELEPLTDYKLVLACAAFKAESDLSDPKSAMCHVLASLARRWLELHEEIKIHARHLKQLVKDTAPALVGAFGIGPDIAGELLVAAGDNSDRIHSEAAFAKLCGASPIPASSGMTTGRHRQPRWKSSGERRALPSSHRPHALARADDCIREEANRRRTYEEGHHPVLEALRRPRGLWATSAPAQSA